MLPDRIDGKNNLKVSKSLSLQAATTNPCSDLQPSTWSCHTLRS